VIREITRRRPEGGRVSTLSLDPPVSLFEPAPVSAAPVLLEPAPRIERRPRVEGARRGRRTEPPRVPCQPLRARRASAASTTSLVVLVQTARLVAVRVLGTAAAAAAVTWALAVKSTGEPGAVAALSIRGLAVAAVICAAWGFQDRPRLGSLGTVRAWYGTALVLALAHTAWFAATLPGAGHNRVSAAAAAFLLDVVLVAAPALLGARAGRPEARPAS
jgi:hypothetical protein